MKVRAIQFGYYNNEKKRIGEEFELMPVKAPVFDKHGKPVKDENGKQKVEIIPPEKQFSIHWMEKVEEEAAYIPKPKSKKKEIIQQNEEL